MQAGGFPGYLPGSVGRLHQQKKEDSEYPSLWVDGWAATGQIPFGQKCLLVSRVRLKPAPLPTSDGPGRKRYLLDDQLASEPAL
ncbi:MAG TPA: hypothetical protein DDW52_26855 [Planctomycetaceae bacterium]|nr:hypothetical protein [Planctomycetaceae bacterium]